MRGKISDILSEISDEADIALNAGKTPDNDEKKYPKLIIKDNSTQADLSESADVSENIYKAETIVNKKAGAKEKKAEEYKNIHAGHRERVRNAHDNDKDFDTFSEHEVLEYALFSVIDRIDTNPLAHRLINEFGSFWAVLNAKPDELMKIDGVSEKVARHLCSYIPVARKAKISRLKRNVFLDTTVRASSYIKAYFENRDNEYLYLISLDINDRLRGIDKISEGDVSFTSFDIKKIVLAATRHGASKCIVAHNHPSNTLYPSDSDIDMTKKICFALTPIGILLVDHIIITDDDYFSFYMSRTMELVYNECDSVFGTKIVEKVNDRRQRKFDMPQKYVLEKDSAFYEEDYKKVSDDNDQFKYPSTSNLLK